MDQTPDVTQSRSSQLATSPAALARSGLMPMCSATGNAIFAATGKRIRTTPFGRNGVCTRVRLTIRSGPYGVIQSDGCGAQRD